MKLIRLPDNQRVWIKHGEGSQEWPDGAKYTGGWHEDQVQGEGKFLYANQDEYEGEFFADRANGFGRYVQKCGETYEGFWAND